MATGNWLDRAIGYFAPKRGFERVQFRAAMDVALAYEAAGRGRVQDGWLVQGTSGDAEVGQYHRRMRELARDLVRNNPIAAKGLAVDVTQKVGTGIVSHPNGPNQRINKRLSDRWARFIDRCDVAGNTDFYGLQALIERTRSQDGETLVRMVKTDESVRADIPFQLQVLEPDYIDSDKNEVLSDGGEIRYGIEYRNNRPVAYWLFDTHPGDAANIRGRRGYQSRRFDASEFLHVRKMLRPGQTRGITDFAPVILRLKGLDDYDAAELMRKKVAACLTAFVTTPVGLPGASLAPTVVGSDGRRQEKVEPGMIAYGKPGESITFNDPKPSSDYESFNRVQTRAVASGLGQPYELLSGDHSQANYTTYRMAMIQFRASVEADQWQVLVPQLCDPICRRFTSETLRVDALSPAEVKWVYTPPRFGLLDPGKEVPAMVESLAAGIDSFENVVRGQGYDPNERIAEHVRFLGEIEKHDGLKEWFSFLAKGTGAKAQAEPPTAPMEDVDAEAA